MHVRGLIKDRVKETLSVGVVKGIELCRDGEHHAGVKMDASVRVVSGVIGDQHDVTSAGGYVGVSLVLYVPRVRMIIVAGIHATKKSRQDIQSGLGMQHMKGSSWGHKRGARLVRIMVGAGNTD